MSGAFGGSAHPASRTPDSAGAPQRADGPVADEVCDHCGSTALSWRKCKLICANCSQIMKSCADL